MSERGRVKSLRCKVMPAVPTGNHVRDKWISALWRVISLCRSNKKWRPVDGSTEPPLRHVTAFSSDVREERNYSENIHAETKINCVKDCVKNLELKAMRHTRDDGQDLDNIINASACVLLYFEQQNPLLAKWRHLCPGLCFVFLCLFFCPLFTHWVQCCRQCESEWSWCTCSAFAIYSASGTWTLPTTFPWCLCQPMDCRPPEIVSPSSGLFCC